MGKIVVAMLLALVATLAGAQDPAVPVRSALEPATTGGIEVVERALAKLTTHRRLLVIGAHPDDEDTSLLTLVSRGLGGEAAYLALSRGDGGQNLIGRELGQGLGLIRTQELMAARRVDGAHQFFTRAFDFGYTRSLDETLQRWPRDVLLEDVARVVWRFRPQVIVAMFSPGIGGHGQHLASGWAAEEVFRASGDTDRFAALIEEGWQPWQPTVLYRRTWFDPEAASFEVSLGQVESLSGKSILQLAMQGRSQHRSQDMGMLQPLGAPRAGLEWVAGGVGPEADALFAGVDTTLAAIAHPLEEGELRERLEAALAAVSELAEEARQGLAPARLSAAVPTLAEILDTVRALHDELTSLCRDGYPCPPGARIVAALLQEKIAVAEAGLAAAAGIGLEATSDRETVTPGAAAELVASVWNSGEESLRVIGVEVLASPSWQSEARQLDEPVRLGVDSWGFTVRLDETAAPSMPYFLERPADGDLYDWSSVEPQTRGLPYQAPELRMQFHLALAGTWVKLVREVVHRSRDQALGELRRPLRIVPRAEISVQPTMMLWGVDDGRLRAARVTVRSHLDSATSGEIRVTVPQGWSAAATPFAIGEPAGETTVEVIIEPPDAIGPGRYRLDFVARLEGGEEESLSVPVLEYSHIRPSPMPIAAGVDISALDLALPEVGAVGYVRGASDRLPELLEQVGVDVELLDAADLARGSLDRFKVIVIGSRAYETDPVLASANSRLLDFVRSGGRLIVQYQQYQFIRGGFAPYGLDIARPHDRITDETAPVRILDPNHPIFTTPNRLGDSDWEGWVQERGLYFAHSWDDAFAPLLAIADPGSEERLGGLLVARLGEGVYIYTGLAFFRQLPAGVAGGYRLFANLLAVE